MKKMYRSSRRARLAVKEKVMPDQVKATKGDGCRSTKEVEGGLAPAASDSIAVPQPEVPFAKEDCGTFFTVVDRNNPPQGFRFVDGFLRMDDRVKGGPTLAQVMVSKLVEHFHLKHDERMRGVAIHGLNLVDCATRDDNAMSPEARATNLIHHIGGIAIAADNPELSPETRRILADIERTARRVILSETFFDSVEPEMQRRLVGMMRDALAKVTGNATF